MRIIGKDGKAIEEWLFNAIQTEADFVFYDTNPTRIIIRPFERQCGVTTWALSKMVNFKHAVYVGSNYMSVDTAKNIADNFGEAHEIQFRVLRDKTSNGYEPSECNKFLILDYVENREQIASMIRTVPNTPETTIIIIESPDKDDEEPPLDDLTGWTVVGKQYPTKTNKPLKFISWHFGKVDEWLQDNPDITLENVTCDQGKVYIFYR